MKKWFPSIKTNNTFYLLHYNFDFFFLLQCLPARKPFKMFLKNMDNALNEVPDSQRTLTTNDYMEMLKKSQVC